MSAYAHQNQPPPQEKIKDWDTFKNFLEKKAIKLGPSGIGVVIHFKQGIQYYGQLFEVLDINNEQMIVKVGLEDGSWKEILKIKKTEFVYFKPRG